MKRLLGVFAVVLLAGLLVTASAAGSRKSAESAAKKVASNYIERFGISYPPKSWIASCKRQSTGWKCQVKTVGKQCGGSLRLRKRPDGRFKSYDIRIGCGE